MRILHVAYQQLRRYGHTRVSWAQKLFFGLVRNGYFVQSFSDRDVAAFEAPLGIRELGIKRANQRLLETAQAVEPDLVIVGHCDMISNDTLLALRKRIPNVRIAGCNNDPLFIPENVAKIHQRCEVVDAMFVSTGLRELAQFEGKRARLFHMPNPVDASIECYDASQQDTLPIDLIYCSNATAHTKRGEQLITLKNLLPTDINFRTFGSFGEPAIWGRDYDRALAQSRMGLNFNRQEGLHWYSSARIAQLAGNGILVFTHSSAGFERLFPEETLVYFDELQDLADKITHFHVNDQERKRWAGNARRFFHEEMNGTLNARYIVESTLDLPYSHRYVWAS